MDDSIYPASRFNHCFAADDYDRINLKYFSKLRDNNQMSADPSGWLNTVPEVTKIMTVNAEDIVPYYSDYHLQLKKCKSKILELLSQWDNLYYDYDEITLCHSVTVGFVIVLTSLLKLGIRNIFFESPAYFSTINQAKYLGFNTILMPTYYDSNFQFNISADLIRKNSPCAIIVTQPRTSLGYNQDNNNIQYIGSCLSKKDYLIIDEASEQIFPSVLNLINNHNCKNIIKLRSFIKGMGLNGIRLSFIAHSKELRLDFQNHMEIFQGAIDYNSLKFIYELSANIENYKTLLGIANQQVVNLRENVEKTLLGSKVEASKLVNGYMGSLFVPLNSNSIPFLRNRELLLKYCFERKMPIITGATMRFARDSEKEFIKINYFKSHNEIMQGIKILLGFFNRVQ